MRPRTLDEVPKIGQVVPVGHDERLLPVRTIDAAGLPVVGGEARLDDERLYNERLQLLGNRFVMYGQVSDELDMGGIGKNLPRRQVA